MVSIRLFVVLTWFSLCSYGDAEIFLPSTCDTIKNQLRSINSKIVQVDASLTTTSSASHSLQLFLGNYDQLILNKKNYKDKMHDFVHAKLNAFSIPVVGLQDDASQLEKVFQHVAERKRFYEQLLEERNQECGNFLKEKENLQKAIIDEDGKKTDLNRDIKDMEDKINEEHQKKQQLQAKINGNPPAIQG